MYYVEINEIYDPVTSSFPVNILSEGANVGGRRAV